ncbi:MAG TPA: hypothetical protein VLJ37_00385 [bacterium]|nr:hypothetical protein [bacterium]
MPSYPFIGGHWPVLVPPCGVPQEGASPVLPAPASGEGTATVASVPRSEPPAVPALWAAHPLAPFVRSILDRLERMDAGDPSANSLHEYLSHEIAQAVLRSGEDALWERFSVLLLRSYSLADLERFCEGPGFGPRFRLVDAPARLSAGAAGACVVLDGQGLPGDLKGVLQRFVGTVDWKRRCLVHPDGFSEAHPTPVGEIPGVFLTALADPRLAPSVAGELRAAPSHATAYLRLNRLFHVLSRRTPPRSCEHKVFEFGGLPFVKAGYDSGGALRARSADEIRGTIHTGFLDDPELAASVLRFWREAERLLARPLEERTQRWEDLVRASAVHGDTRSPERLGALARIYDDGIARELAARLHPETGDLRTDFFSVKALRAYVVEKARAQGTSSASAVEAAYEHPLLGDPEKRFLMLDSLGERDVAANLRHEYLHVRQIEERGLAWRYLNFVASEVEAYLEEILLRLASGEEGFLRLASSVSPYGLLLSLRLFVEQTYLRKTR